MYVSLQVVKCSLLLLFDNMALHECNALNKFLYDDFDDDDDDDNDDDDDDDDNDDGVEMVMMATTMMVVMTRTMTMTSTIFFFNEYFTTDLFCSLFNRSYHPIWSDVSAVLWSSEAGCNRIVMAQCSTHDDSFNPPKLCSTCIWDAGRIHKGSGSNTN